MFEVQLKEFRAGLSSVLPFCGKSEPFDRVRVEVRDDVAFVSSTTNHAAAVARVSAQVWDETRGAVFEVSVGSAKKILAVHTPARNDPEQGMQRVLFEIEDAGTNLRSQDTSGLFPGTEALTVPLEEYTAGVDVLSVIGSRLHLHADVMGRPGGIQFDGRGLALSLRLFDTAVKAFKAATIVRLTQDRRSAIVQVGGSFIGVTSTLALPQGEREPWDGEQPVIASWPVWLEELPDAHRDDLPVFGPKPAPAKKTDDDSDEEDAAENDDAGVDVTRIDLRYGRGLYAVSSPDEPDGDES